MQDHPVLGNPLFVREILAIIDEKVGFSAGEPPQRDSLVARARRATANALRRAADRVEARSPNSPDLVNCEN